MKGGGRRFYWDIRDTSSCWMPAPGRNKQWDLGKDLLHPFTHILKPFSVFPSNPISVSFSSHPSLPCYPLPLSSFRNKMVRAISGILEQPAKFCLRFRIKKHCLCPARKSSSESEQVWPLSKALQAFGGRKGRGRPFQNLLEQSKPWKVAVRACFSGSCSSLFEGSDPAMGHLLPVPGLGRFLHSMDQTSQLCPRGRKIISVRSWKA